jgi:hypothetical protein
VVVSVRYISLTTAGYIVDPLGELTTEAGPSHSPHMVTVSVAFMKFGVL